MLKPKKKALIKAMRPEGQYVQWDENDPLNVSSHLMSSRGREAFPTLFPKDPTSMSHNPQDWLDMPDTNQAYQEAKIRGEVVKFATKRRAAKIALGAWKEGEQNPFKSEFKKEARQELRKEMKMMRKNGNR
jgi:hypothetical protein